MKTITKLVLNAIFILLFTAPLGAFAEIYDLYLCNNAAANLKIDNVVATTLAVGDKVVWQEVDAGGNPIGSAEEVLVTTAGVSPVFPVPTTLVPGEHSYISFVMSMLNCSGDVSEPFKLYVLPATTLALTPGASNQYCENVTTTPTDANVIATPTPGAALPEGVGYAYTWSATSNATPAPFDPVAATFGTATSNSTTGTFTLTTKVKDTYAIKASVSYTVPAGSVFKSGDNLGCVVTSSGAEIITVTPAPGKPVIEIS